ncbi:MULTISPECIES: 5-dehydro-4-deoxy-D-glucuronate isomerase [unclassified Actinopolyspora]|uniref:5-dehydro-4-deoxy-D-glucuronate isomerase n=1 Tax=unclassified Actinopolyspora TaxID=2639451 RepID=UPI0013F5B978|nr:MULTISPECIES: 5-dehydro-4-deoxy-D-glucuronate isomerase [unclassified Actinopolyspora]NHD16096.1 5-dehydro-4-deoxy-D-glucuronate isomerase [Actinopolyspora sp. BKK2]NHE74690.1 5-dehydro-4-deoxy-D-glucuronate isomerase [Actinopolyspora sp. BKK1]
MDVRHPTHPEQIPTFDTAALRGHYLVEDLFEPGTIRTVYSHQDRVVLGGAVPQPGSPLQLETEPPLRSEHFCERRELGILSLGQGTVTVDGSTYELDHRDCLYVGRGTRSVTFDSSAGGHFYLASTPAHTTYPTSVARHADTVPAKLGDPATANVRELRKYVHPDGIHSCELVMGVTELAEGSIWNTMPCHTHDRRTECYLYFDLPEEHRVIHLLGQPHETRSMIVRNEQAVISPSWSVHSGAGTHRYGFVWAMAGENQAFTDMDHVAIDELR